MRVRAHHHRFSGFERLDKAWPEWERWIVDVGESHSTHAMLVFFRSVNPGHSWVTATGTLLDAANLRMAAIESDGEGNAAAWMFLQAATGVLRRIAGFFQIPTDVDPIDGAQLSVSREEFDAVLAGLEAAGLPVVRERDQAWERFAQRRAAYDSALLGLAFSCRGAAGGVVERPLAPVADAAGLPLPPDQAGGEQTVGNEIVRKLRPSCGVALADVSRHLYVGDCTELERLWMASQVADASANVSWEAGARRAGSVHFFVDLDRRLG